MGWSRKVFRERDVKAQPLSLIRSHTHREELRRVETGEEGRQPVGEHSCLRETASMSKETFHHTQEVWEKPLGPWLLASVLSRGWIWRKYQNLRTWEVNFWKASKWSWYSGPPRQIVSYCLYPSLTDLVQLYRPYMKIPILIDTLIWPCITYNKIACPGMFYQHPGR